MKNRDLQEIPSELTKKPRWVNWRVEEIDGRKAKIPFDPETNEPASSTDEETWSDFTTAIENTKYRDYDGVGFVFHEDGDYVGIDFDKCVENRTIQEEEISDLVKKFDSYTEYSPSGTGLHIIVKGEKKGNKSRSGDGIEMYESSRYFTFTGDRLEGLPEEPKERQEQIDDLYEDKIEEEAEKVTDLDLEMETKGVEDFSDEELLEKARNSANGDKFERLWNSTGAAGYQSPSEGDMALMNFLAFWTGGDASRMESLFSKSSRGGRDKWRKRKDYRQRTIREALAGTTEYYDPEEMEEMPELDDLVSEEKLKEYVKPSAFEEWEFQNVFPEGHFLHEYINYMTDTTDAYPEYHLGTGLFLLSVSTDRMVEISHPIENLSLNLWIQIMGRSTISRKSTSIKGAEIIGSKGIPSVWNGDKKVSIDTSKQGFVQQLEEGGQSLIVDDEIGKFYGKISQSYVEGIDGFLCNAYDGSDIKQVYKQEEDIHISDPYVNLLAATTPEQITGNLNHSHIQSGYVPRLLFVWAERPKEKMSLRESKDMNRNITLFTDWLDDLHHFFNDYYSDKGVISSPLVLELEEDAWEVFEKWSDDIENEMMSRNSSHLDPFFGRMKDYAFKIATLIQLGSKEFRQEINGYYSQLQKNNADFDRDDIKTPIVSEEAMRYGLFYINKVFLQNAKDVSEVVEGNSGNGVLKVYKTARDMSDENNVIGHSELMRKLKANQENFRENINSLNSMKKLRVVKEDEDVHPDKDGRFYQILSPENELELPEIELPNGKIEANLWN